MNDALSSAIFEAGFLFKVYFTSQEGTSYKKGEGVVLCKQVATSETLPCSAHPHSILYYVEPKHHLLEMIYCAVSGQSGS